MQVKVLKNKCNNYILYIDERCLLRGQLSAFPSICSPLYLAGSASLFGARKSYLNCLNFVALVSLFIGSFHRICRGNLKILKESCFPFFLSTSPGCTSKGWKNIFNLVTLVLYRKAFMLCIILCVLDLHKNFII